MGKRVLPRRADIPEPELEVGVVPCLDDEGSYTKGMVKYWKLSFPDI